MIAALDSALFNVPQTVLSRPQILRLSGRGNLPPFDAAARVLPAWMQFERASGAEFFDGAGNRVQVGPNVPRFAPVGLIGEGVAQNGIRNPAANGAITGVIGSGGQAPTNWGVPNHLQGVTIDVEAGTLNGVPGLYVRCVGTTTANWNPLIIPDNSSAISAAVGQVWTASPFVQLVEGSWPWAAMHIAVVQYAGPTFLGGINSPNLLATAGTFLRREFTATLTQATTDNIRLFVWANSTIAPGTNVNFRIFVGLPQLVQSPIASTPVPPPPLGGPLVATTRQADRISSLLSTLRIPVSGACAVLMRCVLPQISSLMPARMLVQVSDGTNADRVGAYVNNDLVVPYRLTANAFAQGPSAGIVAANVPFAVGVGFDGAGRCAVSLGGAPATAITGAPTAFTQMNFQSRADGGNALFGAIQRVQIFRRAMSDAELSARAAAF